MAMLQNQGQSEPVEPKKRGRKAKAEVE